MGRKGRSRKQRASGVQPSTSKKAPEEPPPVDLGAIPLPEGPPPSEPPREFKGYRTGEMIYHGMPMAFAFKDNLVNQICHFCLFENPKLVCEGCNYFKYCKTECQENDTYHTFECPKLQKVAPNFPTMFTRYIAEAVTKFKQDNLHATGEVCGRYAVTFADLECCRHQISSEESLKKLCDEYKLVVSYLGETDMISFGAFAEVYTKAVQFGTKVYQPNCLKSIGIGLYIGLQLFRHSCVPNAIPTWCGRRIQLHAMEDVRLRNSLMVSVNMLGYSARELLGRLLKMKALCIPKCRCKRCLDRCEDEEFFALTHECTDPTVKRVFCANQLIKTIRKTAPEDADKIIKIGVSAWNDMGSIFGQLHILRAKLARILCESTVSRHKFREARVYALKLLHFYRAYYGPNHVRTSFAFLFLSFLDGQLNRPQTSKKNFEMAMEKYAICIGKHHPFYKRLCVEQTVLEDAGGWNEENIKKTSPKNYVFRGGNFLFY